MDSEDSSVIDSMSVDRNVASQPTETSARRTWVHKSAAAEMIDIDPTITAVLGWEPSDLLGKTTLDFIHPDDQALAIENWMQMLGAPGPAVPLRFRHRHRDGSWRWVEMTNYNFLDDPSRACVSAELLVSEEPVTPESEPSEPWVAQPAEVRPLQLHEALRAREELLHRLAEALPVGVLHVDAQGRVLYTNQRLHTILNQERAASFIDQFSTVIAEDVPKVVEAFETALHGGLDNDIEVQVTSSEARGVKDIRQCTLNVRTLGSEQEGIVGAVACLTDVTESIRMRDELRRQATFDTLTSCFNRASTLEALDEMLAHPASDGANVAVIFIDVDHFKEINDHLGHGAGDQMLEIVARRLRRALREPDVVGRIGGDEFLVLCPGIHSSAEALRTANRVARSLRRSVKLRTAEVSCRASVGVAWSADTGVDPDTLIGQADSAMYEAKRFGQGRPVLYGATKTEA